MKSKGGQIPTGIIEEVRQEDGKEVHNLSYELAPADGKGEHLGNLHHEVEAEVYLVDGKLEGRPTKELRFYMLCDKGWWNAVQIPIFADRFESEEKEQAFFSSMNDYLSYYLPQRLLGVFTLVIDEALVFACEKHKIISLDKKDLIEEHNRFTAKWKKKALHLPGQGRPRGSVTKQSKVEEKYRNNKAKIIGAITRLYINKLNETANNEILAEDAITKTNVSNELGIARGTLNAWLSKGNLDFDELVDQAMRVCRKKSR